MKFKIGDKVQVIGRGRFPQFKENQVGFVSEKIGADVYRVTFSENPFLFETDVRTRTFFDYELSYYKRANPDQMNRIDRELDRVWEANR